MVLCVHECTLCYKHDKEQKIAARSASLYRIKRTVLAKVKVLLYMFIDRVSSSSLIRDVRGGVRKR